MESGAVVARLVAREDGSCRLTSTVHELIARRPRRRRMQGYTPRRG